MSKHDEHKLIPHTGPLSPSGEASPQLAKDHTVSSSENPPHEPNTLVSPMDRTPRPKNDAVKIFSVGDIVDKRFALQAILGSGGMSTVFAARYLQQHQSSVAIKLIAEEFSSHPHAFSALIREAQKTMTLQHRNIVKVIGYGGDEEHYVYLIMEHLHGQPLTALTGNAITEMSEATLRQRLDMVQQFAEGLNYAHSNGIIHADLKPANIFLTDNNTIKILDFGIARAVNEDLLQEGFDISKLKALTLPYASPEMLRFESPHVSDDIYALGIIVCELLFGFHPFGKQDALTVLSDQLPGELQQQLYDIKYHKLIDCLQNCFALTRSQRYVSVQKFLNDFAKIRI